MRAPHPFPLYSSAMLHSTLYLLPTTLRAWCIPNYRDDDENDDDDVGSIPLLLANERAWEVGGE
jgi:hypothetical protein